jgi:hypothetical protein
LSNRKLGEALDAAWLAYMKDRPLVAKGYLDNPHGRWMRGQAEQMTTEEQQIREKARAGTLLPPGRRAEDKPLQSSSQAAPRQDGGDAPRGDAPRGNRQT